MSKSRQKKPGAPKPKPKKGSGYAGRKQRRQREEEQRRLNGLTAARRVELAGPPPKRAVRRAMWVSGILADLLFETIGDETLTAPEVRKAAGDLGDRIMRNTQKALYEETIADLEERLGISIPEHGPNDEKLPTTGSTPLRADTGGVGGAGAPRAPADPAEEEGRGDPS